MMSKFRTDKLSGGWIYPSGASNFPSGDRVCSSGAANLPSGGRVCSSGPTNLPSGDRVCSSGPSNYPSGRKKHCFSFEIWTVILYIRTAIFYMFFNHFYF